MQSTSGECRERQSYSLSQSCGGTVAESLKVDRLGALHNHQKRQAPSDEKPETAALYRFLEVPSPSCSTHLLRFLSSIREIKGQHINLRVCVFLPHPSSSRCKSSVRFTEFLTRSSIHRMNSGDPYYPQVDQYPSVEQAESSYDSVPFEPDTTFIALRSPDFDQLRAFTHPLCPFNSLMISRSCTKLFTPYMPLGFVYLVDQNLKIRWAGGGLAREEESASLRNCISVLLERFRPLKKS